MKWGFSSCLDGASSANSGFKGNNTTLTFNSWCSSWCWAHQLSWFKSQGPLRLRLSPNTQSHTQWTVEPFSLQYLEQRKIKENSFSPFQPWRVRKVAREMQGRPRNLPRAGHSVSIQRLCVQKHQPPFFYNLEPNTTLLQPILFLYPVVNL